jgi:hypothetical protein
MSERVVKSPAMDSGYEDKQSSNDESQRYVVYILGTLEIFKVKMVIMLIFVNILAALSSPTGCTSIGCQQKCARYVNTHVKYVKNLNAMCAHTF